MNVYLIQFPPALSKVFEQSYLKNAQLHKTLCTIVPSHIQLSEQGKINAIKKVLQMERVYFNIKEYCLNIEIHNFIYK